MNKLSREIYVCRTGTTGRLEIVLDQQATAQESRAQAKHTVEAEAWRRRYAPVLARGTPAPAVAEEAAAWRREAAPVLGRGAPAPAVAEEAEAWRRRRRRRKDAPVLDRGAPAPSGAGTGRGRVHARPQVGAGEQRDLPARRTRRRERGSRGNRRDRGDRRFASQSRFLRWVRNKGWWGTGAGKRMPPSGTAGEPQRKSAATISSEGRRNQSLDSWTSQGETNRFENPVRKRGGRSKESRERRAREHNRRKEDSRRLYRSLRRTIPEEERVPAQTTPRTNWALKAEGPNTGETREIKGWREYWDTQDREYKNRRATRRNAPKWKYAGKLRIASINVRSMREITKREQLTTYMKNKGLDIVCLQETKILSSSLKQRGEFTFVFASSAKTGTDYHGVGICYRRSIETYRNHYIQHTSHLAEIEINMHGNPLVIFSAYIPHDAANAEARVAAWDELPARVGKISHNKDVLALGDYNVALHARKEGE